MESSSPADTSNQRLPKEGHAAFRAFCAYRDMALEERSLRAAAQALGKSKSLIERWSVRHRWMERTSHSDRINEQEEMKAKEADAQKLHKQHLQGLNIAAVPRLKIAIALAQRGSEVDAYLHKVPIRSLYKLQLRALRGILCIHKAERKLEAHVLSIDLGGSNVGGSLAESEPASLTFLWCRCKEDHDYGYPQWPCESAKAYAAFRIYRELGRRRSIRATASKAGLYPSQIERWASKHFWRHRAALYDQHIRNQIPGSGITKERQLLRRQFKELEAKGHLLMKVLHTFDRRKHELDVSMLKLLRMAMQAAPLLPRFQKEEIDARCWIDEIERKGEKTILTLHAKSPKSKLLNEILSEEAIPR